MTQQERRVYLIRALLAENPRFGEIEIPKSRLEQERLLRSLMNVRPPMPAAQAFLDVQDAYLTEEVCERGIVDGAALPPVQSGGRIALWQGDITRLKVDAIVNAANSALLGCFRPLHACVDNVIHSRSGVQLRLCCNEMMKKQGHDEPVGRAKITPAFNLPSKYILHTVGPAVSGPVTGEDCEALASCYRSCLALAQENGCKSIAFCCISTGVFHFPSQRAAEIAVDTVKRALRAGTDMERVIFNVFQDQDLAVYQALLEAV